MELALCVFLFEHLIYVVHLWYNMHGKSVAYLYQ